MDNIGIFKRHDWMGVKSIPVEEAPSHPDTLGLSYHSINRVLLLILESMEDKRYTIYRGYSTKVYKQNH